MIPADTIRMVRRAAGVLLDTNIALLDVVGRLGTGAVEEFKPTADRFDSDDFLLLQELLNYARALVTTPHVLTEVSNLLRGRLGESAIFNARSFMLDRLYLFSGLIEPEAFSR